MVNLIYMDGSGHKMARPVNNREEYVALRNAAENARNFYDARGGNEQAKASQVQFCYNDLLPDGVLRGCCHPSSTFAHDIDCGNAEEQARIKEQLLQKKDEIGLLELSGSARWGLHAVCRRQAGRTIRECQYNLSMATQTEYDTNARGLARVMFTGPATADNLFYLDDALFDEPLTIEESEAEQQRLKEREKRGEEEVPPEAKKANKHYRPWEEETHPQPLPVKEGSEYTLNTPELPISLDEKKYPKEYHGIPFETILKKYWEVNNKGFEPTEGDRDTLTFQLASDLRHICGKSFEWLDQVIPCYDGFPLEEKRQKIRNALASKYEGMPTRLRCVLDALEGKNYTVGSVPVCNSDGTPPEMPAKKPKLIELLVSRTPEVYKPAVAHAVFPSLGAHLHKTRFRYIDNTEHEATLMNCLMAGTGAGKDCISEPINHIMADIRRRDEENLAREKAWKNSVNSKGANKDKAQRPEGLIIQEIDPDVTNAAFVQRMADADEHFLYVKLNEIDQFDALKGNGRGNHQFQIMCLAFDTNDRYGQTRIGTQSVTEKVSIRFNWNASTTVKKGLRYFQNVLTDGPVSRINFCTIPRREIGADMPIYGTYDAQYDEQLRPYIERLCAARGTIDCPQAYKLAQRLKNECAEFARVSQSETYWNLSFRANVIAYLKACVLFVAHDYTWTKDMEQFVRWSLQYDLWCKMHFFGEAIEAAEQGGTSTSRRGPRNLLELLPNEFTFDDAISVRRQQGLPREGTQDMIRTWRNRGYIEERTNSSNSFSEPNAFTKLKYRH